jgi:hypothetical protein
MGKKILLFNYNIQNNLTITLIMSGGVEEKRDILS